MDLARAQPVLDFFSARVRLPPVWLDPSLAEDALCTREGIALHPAASEGPHFAAVLAHELFHFWSRSLVPPARWGGLPRQVPRFAVERSYRLPSLNGAGVEELAADLLTERLCARLGVPFAPAYLTDLPPGLVAARIDEARALLSSVRLQAGVPEHAAVLEEEQARLQPIGEALRRLSGFELAALAFHELRPGASISVTHFPLPLRALPLEVQVALAPPLEALDAPALLTSLWAFFVRPHVFGFERGPLWDGPSPLELPGRALAARLRDSGGRDHLRDLLRGCLTRLGGPP